MVATVSKPTVTVNDVTVDESARTATFTVTRSGNTSQKFNVDYATGDGSAMAGDDYTTTSGALKFAGGQTTKTVTVPIINDTSYEGDETFSFNLSNPTGGTQIADGHGQATIIDNDPDNDPKPIIIHEHESISVPMYGTHGVQDIFVLTSTPNWDLKECILDPDVPYEPETNPCGSHVDFDIFGFERGDGDRIVLFDRDGNFEEMKISTGLFGVYITSTNGSLIYQDPAKPESLFQFLKSSTGENPDGSIGSDYVSGFVFDHDLDLMEDVRFVVTTDPYPNIYDYLPQILGDSSGSLV